MTRITNTLGGAAAVLVFSFFCAPALQAQSVGSEKSGGLNNVNHIIVIMQENHSFDNYFGALAYAPRTPYHRPSPFDAGWNRALDGLEGCRQNDHTCIDGLNCQQDSVGDLHCFNANLDDDGSWAFSFHDGRRCVIPDLDHSWLGSHRETNYLQPNDALGRPLNDGLVLVNDQTEQLDNGVETSTDDQTMTFYAQGDLPFYYGLAESFALNDRYFSSILGPTFPNRSYLAAATSFGHVSNSDTVPPPGGYKPITGTIFDLLTNNHVAWADYFQDLPQGGAFLPFGISGADPHFLPLSVFLAQAAGAPALPPLPSVVFVDPNFGALTGTSSENDEHPPTDIQRGQAYVSQVINAIRSGPYWKDSVILLTYDEGGGFYDHVHPPRAPQGHASTPDGIAPGQCEDLSNLPASEQPGGGAECSTNFLNPVDNSVADAEQLCPSLANNPTGPYPASCANFDQLGFRVPFVAISPFSKPHYVSHTIGDHTSILALIENRFLPAPGKDGDANGDRVHSHLFLTKRDEHANTLEDMFDFDNSPSLNTPVTQAVPPTNDCTPLSTIPVAP